MLDDRKKKLIKMLVALAWADGRLSEEEMEIVEAMIDSFQADAQGAEEIRSWAQTPRTLEDIDTSDLDAADLEMVLFQAVLLTYIDGEQSPKEVELLNAFIEKLGLGKEQAEEVLQAATARAQDLLPELQA